MKDKGKTGCGPRWGWARHREAGGWSPPWARGFGFGGPGGGPRSPRLFGQGDLRLLLLALIADKPSHGYDLIRTIEARFNGSYAPSAGTVYPTLTLLEEQDSLPQPLTAAPRNPTPRQPRASAILRNTQRR